MKKFLSILLACFFIITLFSACKKDEAALEDYTWKLDSVVSLNDNGKEIAVGDKDKNANAKVIDATLIAKNGELIFDDNTNSKTYKGAYEEMLVTDSTDDYKIILNGKEGLINMTKTVYPDGTEEPMMIITVDDYDLYFYSMKGE